MNELADKYQVHSGKGQIDELKDKSIRVIEYLQRITSLRTKVVRDIKDYEHVVWLSDIPKQNGCFTQAWGRDEDYDSDIWIEVITRKEPALPAIPDKCEGWVNESSLRNKDSSPDLLPTRNREIENPEWEEGSDEPEHIVQTEHLNDFPDVREAWNRYLEEKWSVWVDDHNAWECVHKIYSNFFAIHQEQRRLGEEYEIVLGIGLLTWQTPTGQRVRRHLLVADALLEFDARQGKFTVYPHADGAKVRPELNMLDVEEQPINAENEAKNSLGESGDDPWDKDCIEGVLQGLVHSIDPQGEYYEILKKEDRHPSAKPVVEYAPALILRKRSATGLKETLRRIKEKIKKGGDIPAAFADLAETRTSVDRESDYNSEEQSWTFNGEIFFPKPANDEQRRIVDKISSADGVLVQGPPGTGKSHTIANLICHLLATGQRTLITAKTPRALRVLEGLIPSELLPLCINLLGSGRKEQESLESSVNGILRKNEEWNEEDARQEREKLQEMLRTHREEQAKINRRIRAIRESETHTQSIADGVYRGTAAQIAKAVNRDRSKYEWFTDKVSLEQTHGINSPWLTKLLHELRYFTKEKRKELELRWPDELPSVEDFDRLIRDEKDAINEEQNIRSEYNPEERIVNLLLKENLTDIDAIQNSLTTFFDQRRKLASSPYPWMADALQYVLCGNSFIWKERASVTKERITSIAPRVEVADNNSIEIPDNIDVNKLCNDARRLKEHMEKGGKLGWWLFRPKPVKDRLYVIKNVRVNGKRCSTVECFSILCDALYVRIECDKVWHFWQGKANKTLGPYALQLTEIKSMYNALEQVLSLEDIIKKCREAIKRIDTMAEPAWNDESQIKRLIGYCQLARAHHRRDDATEKIKRIEGMISSVANKDDAHPVTTELLRAVRDRDLGGFENILSTVHELKHDRRRLEKADKDWFNLRQIMPNLAENLKRDSSNPDWDERIQHIREAWLWAQARYWIEKYIRKEDLPALTMRVKQIEDKLQSIVAKLAAVHAWSFCFSRLKEDHRRHMEAWRQSMRRIGKGTGKHASRHRREAQHHLNQCREAVPAWVMPLHRIWETVEPAPEMFDIIIVDEASQCGLEALTLFYIGKKVLIVGDDKQISPEVGFVDKNKVFQLMGQFLNDFKHKDSFHRDASLFDHGKLRYGTQRITLREHFRCMPEIIRFSNDLCYVDTPLIPLRQYGHDRLPPLQRIFVERGYREGSSNRAINRPEAEAIVDKIAGLCSDERYYKKTMGVVVLQGEAQAKLIEDLLLKRLGAEEIEQRRLICGNPYSFQGDERDVIFLSMVAAPNERIGPLAKPADERRFNVAVSRARDQIWLFHSVQLENLSEKDLRRKLLEFFQDIGPQHIAGIERDELERKAKQDNRSIVKPPEPFESWFEVDVALELLRRGFSVTPQFEVAGKRIDLVVEGGHARLAIECDGDHWHGLDRYEEDMQRQRQLERCGWEFFRVRESTFYANKDLALRNLWSMLQERGICSSSSIANPHTAKFDSGSCEQFNGDEIENAEGTALSRDEDRLPVKALNLFERTGLVAKDVKSEDIHEAIIQALSKCPNQSCTEKSLTSLVLKELKILTRGRPRKNFKRRVMQVVRILEESGKVKLYKAKNKRVKLL